MEKAIYIDECWQLIGASSNRLAAEFVLEIFKIIRGYGGSAICATQDINDFFALEDGKYGKGIINNAQDQDRPQPGGRGGPPGPNPADISLKRKSWRSPLRAG